MKHFWALVVTTLLLPCGAYAEQIWTLHGLLCNTEAQARDVVQHFGSGMSLRVAVAKINEGAVNCVVADRIQYVVSRPLIINTINRNGFRLTLYQASLVAIQIGENTRPIAPPLRTYFVLDNKLGGVAPLSGI